MSHLTTDEVQDIANRIAAHGLDESLRIIALLEEKLEFVCSVVTRSDVQDIYKQMWTFEGTEPKDMTEEEWARFKQEWFWRKGHSEVMWEDVEQAIRMDLRDMALAPEEAVID